MNIASDRLAPPAHDARVIFERALEPFAPSRTQLKKMVAAVMQEWMPHREPASVTVTHDAEWDGPVLVGTREKHVERTVLILLSRGDLAGIE